MSERRKTSMAYEGTNCRRVRANMKKRKGSRIDPVELVCILKMGNSTNEDGG